MRVTVRHGSDARNRSLSRGWPFGLCGNDLYFAGRGHAVQVGAMIVAVSVGRGGDVARYPKLRSTCLAVLYCAMHVTFRHGSNGGRVRIRDRRIHVGRPLIDWLGSRGDGLCERCASCGDEAVKDGRPEGRGKPGHCVCTCPGRTQGEASSATRRGRTDERGGRRVYQVGTRYVPSAERVRAPGLRERERGVTETSGLWLRLFRRGWVSVG